MQPANPRYRYLYVVGLFMETIVFGGPIFGWGSLVYVLKAEGLYSYLCPELNNNGTMPSFDNFSYGIDAANRPPEKPGRQCVAQDDRLGLAFSAVTAFYCVASFAAGQLNYKFGTRVTRLVSCAVFIIASVITACATKEVPWLIFPGLCLMAGSGVVYFMTNLQIALLFPKNGPLVIGLICGAFQGSTGMTQLMKLSYEGGVSLRTSFLVLAGSHLLTLVSTLLILPKGFIKKPDPEPALGDLSLDVKEEQSARIQHNGVEDGGAKPEEQVKPKQMLPSIGSLMATPTFLLHAYWVAVLQLRFLFQLTSLNPILEELLPSLNQVSHYTNVTAYILPGGLVLSPLSGAFYAFQQKRFSSSVCPLRRKLMPAVLPLALGTSFGVALSSTILIPNAVVIYAVFLLLIWFRAFIYTLFTALLLAIYPNEYFGFMFGVIMMVSGAANMLQYGFFYWANHGSFFQVNLFLLVLTGSTCIHPMYQWWAVYRASSRSTEHSEHDTVNTKNTGYETFTNKEQ